MLKFVVIISVSVSSVVKNCAFGVTGNIFNVVIPYGYSDYKYKEYSIIVTSIYRNLLLNAHGALILYLVTFYIL